MLMSEEGDVRFKVSRQVTYLYGRLCLGPHAPKSLTWLTQVERHETQGTRPSF